MKRCEVQRRWNHLHQLSIENNRCWYQCYQQQNNQSCVCPSDRAFWWNPFSPLSRRLSCVLSARRQTCSVLGPTTMFSFLIINVIRHPDRRRRSGRVVIMKRGLRTPCVNSVWSLHALPVCSLCWNSWPQRRYRLHDENRWLSRCSFDPLDLIVMTHALFCVQNLGILDAIKRESWLNSLAGV